MQFYSTVLLSTGFKVFIIFYAIFCKMSSPNRKLTGKSIFEFYETYAGGSFKGDYIWLLNPDINYFQYLVKTH